MAETRRRSGPNPALRRWLRVALGLALSAGALALVLHRTSLHDVGDALKRADWRWLPAMLAVKTLMIAVKNLRWRTELTAMASRRYQRTFSALSLGYFGNMVLPFKLGELLRVGLLARHNPGVAPGDALATIVAERALDGTVLALMVGAVLPAATVPPWVFRGTLGLLLVMVTVIAVGMLAPLHRWLLARLPERGLFRVARRLVAAGSRGTAVLRHPGKLSLAIAYTVVCWLGEALVLFMAGRALGLPLGFAASLIVTLFLSVGLLLPSAPGQLGTHQALTILFLAPFGIDSAAATTLSVMIVMVALAVLSALGGWVLLHEAGARIWCERAPTVRASLPAAPRTWTR